MSMVYQWRDSFRPKVSAQVVGEAVESLQRRTPEALVEKARGDNGDLHGLFEWDDAKAGHAHRLHQARQVMAALVIYTPHKPGEPQRALIHTRVYTAPQYERVEVALADSAIHAEMVRKALAELSQWKNRHAHLTELAPIFTAIDAAKKRLAAKGLRPTA